jgi:arylsulfatase
MQVLEGGTRPEHESLYWAWQDNRAIRQGKWKLAWDVRVGRWELYDIVADRTEMHDLANQEPERVAAMTKAWQAWAERTGAVHHLGMFNDIGPGTTRALPVR